MKLAKTDYCAYALLLVPAVSPAKRLTNAFADVDYAVVFGSGQATRHYPGEAVEVIVIRTATREAVRSVLVEAEEGI